MTALLTMPRLGETMEEGTVSSWLVPVGEAFKRGDPLVVFETDKTAVEYPALGPGRLMETLVDPGDLVQVGAPIARIDLEGAPDWTGATDGEEDTTDPTDSPAAAPPPKATRSLSPGGRVRATPLARRAAERAGLDIETLVGTGRRGRVELVDVETARTGGSPRGSLAYTDYGPAGGPPVLLLHGFAGDRSTFEQLAKGLARRGLRATAVDLPAHGRTTAEAATLEDLVVAVTPLLDPRQPVHLVAHSVGAAVAVKVAARAGGQAGGVASLTLIAPAGLGLSIDAEFIGAMADPASLGMVGHLVRRLSDRAAGFSDTVLSAIHADLSRGRLKTLAGALVADGRQTVNVVSDLALLAESLPVRLLVGHRDTIVDWRDALAVSPRIAVHHFPNAGHMPHWDAPEIVADIILKGVLP
ncbi:MAG: alpha/beta fold hydrolase [Rhodospirillum sp.]|nr:alpha/beta fold hydrolase [Rhodospirillum sp.]MCF8488588.1 alpha/beta fold hydrolase [Rhodospirillum sp.]MCF8503003.1 alpha/beta fold hydrolase [Rhodospirillum sp.]